MPPKAEQPAYAKDEKVLCFHGELLYEAKVLDSKPSTSDDKKSAFMYRVHYKGWKNTWDDWVHADRVRKLTEENKELAQNLKKDFDAARRPPPKQTASAKKGKGSEQHSNRESEERHSSVPATGRGQKRGRDYDLDRRPPPNKSPVESQRVTMKTRAATQAARLAENADGGFRVPDGPAPTTRFSDAMFSNIRNGLAISNYDCKSDADKKKRLERSEKLAKVKSGLELLQLPLEDDALSAGPDVSNYFAQETYALEKDWIVPARCYTGREGALQACGKRKQCTRVPVDFAGPLEPVSKRRNIDEGEYDITHPTMLSALRRRRNGQKKPWTDSMQLPRKRNQPKKGCKKDETKPKDVLCGSSKRKRTEREDEDAAPAAKKTRVLPADVNNVAYEGASSQRGSVVDFVESDTSLSGTQTSPEAPDCFRHAEPVQGSQETTQEAPSATAAAAPLEHPEAVTTSIACEAATDSSQEQDFHSRPSIKFQTPDAIKGILVDDWENVTKNGQLLTLPHKWTVNAVLDAYHEEEKPKRRPNSADADLLEEVIAGLKEYFTTCLGRILLYKYERQQYLEARKLFVGSTDPEWENKDVGDLYGAEHLARLIVSMPELIAQTNMDVQAVHRLKEEMMKMTHWLAKNSSKYFVGEYDAPSRDYVEKARNISN